MSGLVSRLRATGSNRARLAATLLTAAIVALAAAPGAGAVTSVTYYAAPVEVGTGDCSSAANACALGPTATAGTALNKATTASSGDAVAIDLAGGTYTGNALATCPGAEIQITSGSEYSLTLDGSSQSPTVLSGCNDNQVLYLDDGALPGPIELSNLAVEAGTASGAGGDLGIDAGTVTLANVTVANGTNAANGGGVEIGGSSGTPTVTLEDSTVSGNATTGVGAHGSGIYVDGGTLNLSGSTLANNSGSDALDVVSPAVVTVFGSTIADNGYGGIGVEAGGTLYLGASVLAANTANGGADCAVSGTLHDDGYNYADSASCGLSAMTSHNSELSLGPGTLAAHGGPTQTIPITSASQAYDVIPVGATLPSDPESGAFCATTDQRGVPRTQGPATACSAGAFQYAPPVVTSLSPRASLELGLPVTLNGYGFANLTSVTIGAVTPTLTSQSGDALAFNVPLSLSLGSQPVTLSNPDGTTVVTFSAVGSPSVATSTLPPGEYKAAYSQALSVAGGASPYTYALTSGALPAGLSLSSAGVVSGTPTAAGGTAFGVMITDANGFSSLSSTVSLVIATPVVFVKSASVVVDTTSAPPSAPVTLECTAAPCSGTAKLTESVKAHVHGKLKTLNVVLASAPYSLTAGQVAVDDLALTTAGMQALKRAAKHPRTETLSASLDAGTSAARSVRVS